MTDDESYQCQGPTAATNTRPWAGNPRADDHDALARLLHERQDGAPVVWLARTLFGQGVESGDNNWMFVKRHGEQYHSVFQPTARVPVQTAPGEYENRETEPDLLWILPTFTPGESVLDTAGGKSVRNAASAAPGSGSGSSAKADAEGLLSARQKVDTAEVWGNMVGAFAGKRLGEQRANGGPERTRFNTVTRALGGRDRVATAFGGALAEYDHGVLVTATTDPSRFESVAAAAGGLLADAKALRKKLGRAVGESVLPGVTVPEPTARGVPHAHIPVFGAEWAELPSRGDLQDFWCERRERGHQVHVTPLIADDGRWTWGEAGGPANAAGCPPRAYCRQGAEALATVARLDADNVLAVAEGCREWGDVEIAAAPNPDTEVLAVDAVDAAVSGETGVDARSVRWAAWYFATGLQTATRPSTALREAVATEGQGGCGDA